MLNSLYSLFFGCKHSNYSWPFTGRDESGKRFRIYVTCLDCGREMPYDLATMKVREAA